MADIQAVTEATHNLSSRDDESLMMLVGMLEGEIQKNPAVADDPHFQPKYDGHTMGLTDDLKRVGQRVLRRWNKELYGLVCGGTGADQKDREAILGALNLGEAAVMGAVASALISLAVPPPIAAALAPVITRKFIWPAKDELCSAWGEAVAAS